MKILLVTDHLGPYGGAETYFFALKKLYEAKGHEVRAVGDRPRLLHYLSRIFNPWYLAKFLVLLFRFRPDIVHIHKYNLVYSFTPALAARLLGIPAFITMHDFGLICPDGYGLRADGSVCRKLLDAACFSSRCRRSVNLRFDLQRRYHFIRNIIHIFVLKRTVRAFISPSRLLQEWCARYFGPKSLYLPYFIDLEPMPVASPFPREGKTLRIFFAGRLVAEKGLQLFLPALQGLAAELWIAGDGPYRGALEKLVQSLGLEGQVHFLGKIPNDEVGSWLARSQVCVLPSLWVENNPLLGYEAMKNARALLGSRIGGIPDLIEDGVNGFLFENRDLEGLRRRLRAFLDDPELGEAMGRAGLEKARRDYDPGRHHEALLGIFSGRGV